MKKFSIYLVIALSLMMGFGFNVNAESSADQITVSLNKDDIDIREESPKGWRIPAAPILCTIDFRNSSITSGIPKPVLFYQLWDEEGETMLASYSTDSEMVAFMTQLIGVYQLRIVTEDSIYIGYTELQNRLSI